MAHTEYLPNGDTVTVADASDLDTTAIQEGGESEVAQDVQEVEITNQE